MNQNGEVTGAHQIALEAYGVRAVVTTSSGELLKRVESVLPPGWIPSVANEEEPRFSVTAEDGAFYTVEADGVPMANGAELDVAVDVFDAALRAHIAASAPERIFVHAGVVAHRGRAILIPGPTFSGKTTLVAALVKAGAPYYSDEYAVLDDDGLVHPYAKPLSIRTEHYAPTDHDVAVLGGEAGQGPLPVGLVVMALYRPDARWRPRRLSPGEGVLSLLANTVAAQTRPEEALRATTRAVNGASAVLEGERGEAPELAAQLLENLPW